jgi:hypothetical protein
VPAPSPFPPLQHAGCGTLLLNASAWHPTALPARPCPAKCRYSVNPAPAAAGATLVAIFVGVPVIKRKVQRDWEELSKPDAIPELKGAVQAPPGGANVSQGLGGPACSGARYGWLSSCSWRPPLRVHLTSYGLCRCSTRTLVLPAVSVADIASSACCHLPFACLNLPAGCGRHPGRRSG